LSYERIREAFLANGLKGISREESISLIERLGNARKEEPEELESVLPLLNVFLSRRDAAVRNAACAALGKVTGQVFGRDPAAWIKYLEER
jgi:hypothetical protein